MPRGARLSHFLTALFFTRAMRFDDITPARVLVMTWAWNQACEGVFGVLMVFVLRFEWWVSDVCWMSVASSDC